MTKRRMAHAVAVWVFGLCMSVFLIAVWGRSVVGDSDELARSLAPLSDSFAVVDLFTDWLTDEMIETGVDPSVVESAAAEAARTPEVRHAADLFVVELISAAAAVDQKDAVVDVASLLAPAAPAIASALSESLSEPVPPAQVATIIEHLDPLVIHEGRPPLVGPASPIATRLGTAAVLAMVVILCSGWVAVVTADERAEELRRLFNRIALGGLSFGVLLLIGSWIVSPIGGRAPVSETIGLIAGSKWIVPMVVGGVAAAGGIGVAVYVRRYFTPVGEFPPADESPTPAQERSPTPSG